MADRVIIQKDFIKDYDELLEAMIREGVYLQLPDSNYLGVDNNSTRVITKLDLVTYDSNFEVLAKQHFDILESLKDKIKRLIETKTINEGLSAKIRIKEMTKD